MEKLKLPFSINNIKSTYNIEFLINQKEELIKI